MAAVVDDYFSRTWDHGAPEVASALVTQDSAQGYYCTDPSSGTTHTPSDPLPAEYGPNPAPESEPYPVPTQRAGHVSASNPRKFHKRTRSGTKVMLASSAGSKKSPRPKHKRKHSSIGSAVRKSNTQSKRDLPPPPPRPSLKAHSRSNSSTLYRRPRGDQNDRIRRYKRTHSPVQDRMRSLVSPSLLTVLSTLTGTTSSSSGSNVTITPATARSSRHSHRGVPRPRRHHSYRQYKSDELQEQLKPKPEFSASKVNVFDFLDAEASGFNWNNGSGGLSVRFVPHANTGDQQSLPSDTTQHTVDTKDPVTPLQREEHDEPRNNDGFFSDSGVSVGGESPEISRSSHSYGYPSFEPTQQEAEPENDKTDSPASLQFVDASAVAPSDMTDKFPPAQNAMPSYAPMQPFQPFRYDQYHSPPHPMAPSLESQLSQSSFAPSEPTITGYELLASKLSAFPSMELEEESLVPLYRRFEQLHHRVLLHLQDEISELEEQLRILDEYIGRAQQDVDGSSRPASRREEAQYNDRLTYQRTEILGRICVKLSTYDQSLEHYRSMVRKAESAKQEDVTKYKDWLDRIQPIAGDEGTFLDYSHDLVSISSRARQTRQTTGANKADSKAAVGSQSSGFWARVTEEQQQKLRLILLLGVPGAMLMTFIAFAALSNFWARLTVMLILTCVGCMCMHLSELQIPVPLQELMVGVAFYIAVMTILAGMNAVS